MIRVFNHTETNFTHNGIHVLDDIVIGDACILTNEINGVYSLECELSMFNNSKWKDIENEMFLRVPTPKGEQLFRIKEIVKGFSTLKIYGKHVFFDLENNFILDTNIVQKDGRTALTQILGGMSNNMLNTYYGTSDISIINNSRLVRKNVVTALIGADDNSYLNRWGGELDVDNFNFSINKRLGSDNGFQIRYGKNCTGYEGNVNTYNLCTRIVPVGYDGLMLEGTKWVDSPNIAKYPQIYTQEIKYDYIKVKNNPDDEEGYSTIEEARAALKQEALNTFSNTKCDLPTFSARVNFITLENTEEYKNVRFLEKVELGDDVSIYLSNIDVNASSRIVKTKYNFFTKKYIEVEIGEIKPNVFKQIINIKETIDSIVEDLGGNTWQDIINKSLDEATKLMEEGLKDSHVITMKNQIVIGDAPDIKDMVNCIVMNKNGIGFSNNGYLPDRLISAMTIDGKINASCITTGELNAALIKVGVITGKNGKLSISVEDDFIKMNHTEATTTTKIDSKGFYIEDENGETIASLASKESWSELKADKVFADNIENIYLGDANLYVDHSFISAGDGSIDCPFNNFNDLANHLMRNPILNKDVVINVVSSGDVTDYLDLRGLHGRGTLTINLSSNLVLNSNSINESALYFYDCNLIITVTGGRSSWNSKDGALINKWGIGVRFTKCKHGNVRYLAVDSTKNNKIGVMFDSTNGIVTAVDTCTCYHGVWATRGSLVYSTSCCGTATTSYYSGEGALIQLGGESNDIKIKGAYRRVNGNILDFGSGSMSQQDSYRTAPEVPATQTYTATFNSTGLGTYQYAWSNWASGEWGNRAIQGVYSSYGNKSGHIFFNISSIRSFLGSGTVGSCTITLKRRNGGGNSSATNIYICASTCSSTSGTPSYSGLNTLLGSLAWNETKTFTLPTSIVNTLKSTHSSLACYSTSNTGAYAEIVSASITIKVTK